MSRYCGEKVTKPILDAAAHWRDSVLLTNGSVFSEKPLWTDLHVASLNEHFVERPDLGEGVFLTKLNQQLADTVDGAKQLASEMMWLLYLCPANISAKHKRKVIDDVWAWSGTRRPETTWMSDAVLNGIGSGGPGFNQNQWRELAFLINFTRAFLPLPKKEAAHLVGDAWAFDEWLRGVPEWETRQFRHMLLFLLFPDHFERIFGQRDRKTIVQVLGGIDSPTFNSMDPIQLDRTLFETRRKLETEYGTDQLDFYVPPLRDRWRQSNFATAVAAITADHVRSALEEIDREGTPVSAQSTGYDLIEAGRRYPPKLVFSLAAKYATGQEFDRRLFAGGVDSQASKALEKLGFEISSKDLVTPLIAKFLDQAQTGADLTVRGYLEEYRGLQVRVSFGQGNFARVPWIAFLGRGQTVQKGIYPVLLLFKEKNTLLLCYGVSETTPPDVSWEDASDDSQTVSAWFETKFRQQPVRYGNSFVRAAYDVNAPVPFEEIRQELDTLIDQYEEVLGEQPAESPAMPEEPEVVRADMAEACRAFAGALKQSNIDFGGRHEEFVASFIAALISKPLIILTGLSGSGKTQVALRLGEWLGKGKLYVAAVRPDWTGAEALFGYEDGLKPPVDGRSAWSVPAPMAFMLDAAADSGNPYLLLLDEMNLAHVERYFADVLSGMESSQPCLPNLVKGADGMWRIRSQGPDRIPFPRNLWIVGTVNVDETTYMFSPKVLDRANTFEVRVSAEDIGATWRKPLRCEPGDPALIRGLLSVSRDDNWQLSNPAPFQGEVERRLRQLHAVLGRYNMEFGHRVFYEALRYTALANKAGLSSVEKVLDRVVSQKVLPRLHGSRRRLENPVLALMHFCHELPVDVAADEQLAALELEGRNANQAKLRLSFDKLGRLLHNLRSNQFASFTE